MHYANGKPAKVGDKIVGKDCSGRPLSGIVVETVVSTSCNLQVLPMTANTFTATAGECLLLDDAIPAKVV